MWTTVLVITLYNSVWCIHGHIQWFMQYNFLFQKVASPSQCASLWRDEWHARVRWLCWHIFRTFQASITIRPCLAVGREMYTKCYQYIHLSFDTKLSTRHAGFSLTKSPMSQNHSPVYCSESGPRLRHNSPKCGWRHENDFIMMGNVQ